MQLACEKTINFSRLGEVCTTRASGFLGRLFLYTALQEKIASTNKRKRLINGKDEKSTLKTFAKLPFGGRLSFSLQGIDFV